MDEELGAPLIQTGWDVLDANGRSIGKVERADEDGVTLRETLPLLGGRAIPLSAVETAADGVVSLNIPLDELGEIVADGAEDAGPTEE